MDLPQPRPLRSGGKKLTHDFLSLYPSPDKQDPKPAPGVGHDLKTHDFLQPLERGEEIEAFENALVFPTEHLLPGGIGSYSISHASYLQEGAPYNYRVAQGSSSDQKNEESSNCSSHTTGSAPGFSLWDEPVLEKGKRVKESAEISKEAMVKARQSSSTTHRNLSTLSTSLPAEQKNQSFIDMIKSAKSIIHDTEQDDGEESHLNNKNFTFCRGEVVVKIEDKSGDQRASTPRSKHSATEQRRRCKINDRFQMLREIIPHKDHKRDKASFLLEVIEYIRVLQEKVQRYERQFQGWNRDPPKGLPLRSICRPTECPIGNNNNNIPIKSTTGPDYSHHQVLEKVTSLSLPMPLQQNTLNSIRDGGSTVRAPVMPGCDAWQSRRCRSDCSVVTDKLKEADLIIKGGTIRISSAYSQGLLNTLTEAIESLEVDLSQATICVQFELGNRTNAVAHRGSEEVPSSNAAMMLCSRVSGDSNRSQKKLKISKD